MRGTILKLKSDSYNFRDGDEDPLDHSETLTASEPQFDIKYENESPTDEEIPFPDTGKELLMSSLELRSSFSAPHTESSSANQLSTLTTYQRPTFNWNDASMWKAMSRHPLFSKYMEMQAQLNDLFEEIRLDCKKAACEKAFASLVKDSGNNPCNTSHVIIPPKVSLDVPRKKLGRPLKKRGRPRRCATITKSSSFYDSIDHTNTPTPINKTIRKSREELFLARKPSWKCTNCEKNFSSLGWLERHQSLCTIRKFINPTSSSDQNELPGKCSEPKVQTSLKRVHPDAEKPQAKASFSKQPSNSSLSEKPEGSLASVSPLQPKMENHNYTDEDESSIKPPGDNESHELFSTTYHPMKRFDGNYERERKGMTHEERERKRVSRGDNCDSETYLSKLEAKSSTGASRPKPSACKHCGKSFTKHKVLKRHQSLCHARNKSLERSQQWKQCENCSLFFASQKKLLRHQAICCPDSNNEMMKILKCFKCSQVFSSYKKQLKHRALCCPDGDTASMVCKYCVKVFIMPDRMEAHKKKCPKTE